ncbi:hypothetical protein B0J13DRAFT_462015 [Dactylonectria estremocensis]|uniref:Extracellular membrane protein CFEM domain-containing protein n=1 Tax=Dactylonectria estremocensis TaxID=1079267 RepID=A0A9P9D1U2_9HYPO|nr:hypothetical protein B0J13DRAFT_462015 [Dactylonectria estremocensis]
MQILTALFAVIATSSANDWYAQCSASLAGYSSCGKPGTIDDCLSQLQELNESDVKSCYITSGCSLDEAEDETKFVLQLCRQLFTNELKRRDTTSNDPDNQSTTADGNSPTSSANASLADVSICDVHTIGGHTETATCTKTKSLSSTCTANRICTTNAKREDICMVKQGMGVEGVVVGTIFGAAIVVGFFYIFFACFRASRKNKGVASKAQYTDTSRAPLIPKE